MKIVLAYSGGRLAETKLRRGDYRLLRRPRQAIRLTAIARPLRLRTKWQ